MKKIFCFVIAIIFTVFSNNAFANREDDLRRLVNHWNFISALGGVNTAAVYANNPSEISINGMDNRIDLRYLKKKYGEPDLTTDTNYRNFWGTEDFLLDFYGKHGTLIHGIAVGSLSSGNSIKKFQTPKGVYVGMPFTEAQKIYGIREDYAMKLFYVVSPDHTKYLTIYRQSKADGSGTYKVEGIEILPTEYNDEFRFILKIIKK